MKIKKFISLLASLAMMVTAVTGAMSVSALSADDGDFDPNACYTSGKCGTNANWLINSDGVLVISGTGEMTKLYEAVPDDDIYSHSYWGWEKLSQCVNEVVVENGITVGGSANSVGAFHDGLFPFVSKITLPPSLTQLNHCISTQAGKYVNLKDIYVYSKDISDASTINNTMYNSWSKVDVVWHVYKDSTTEASLRENLLLNDNQIEYISDNEEMPTVSNKTSAKIEPVKETSGPAGLSTKYEWNETSKTLIFSGKGTISIPDYFVKYRNTTEHIVINSGITSILADTGVVIDESKSGTFYGFTALQDVELPDTLTFIGELSFYGDPLTSINLPEGLIEIDDAAFKNCSNLENITFPESLNKIGDSAFQFCSKLKSINFHEGMIIGGRAFNGCESLKELTIPKNVRFFRSVYDAQGMSREPATFMECTGLEKIVIEDGNLLVDPFNQEFTKNGIADQLCLKCYSLKTVVIKGDIDCIRPGAFASCTSLTDIYLYNTELKTITAKGTTNYVGGADPNVPDQWIDSIWTGNNPTFHVIKGSTTEQTLKDAGYLNDENTVYIADTTALETAVSEAEAIETDKYTEESVSAFTKVIENAKAVLENLDATQDEVDSAVKAIEDAKTALVEKPDEPSSDNTSDSSNSSGNNNQSQSPNTPATPSTSAPTTATPKPVTPPAVTTTVAKPAKVKAVKVKAKKKKLNVSWKKVSGATGYEVLSATNNKFTKNKKSVTVKKNKVTLKRLKSKKKYFVKVRAYKLANGRKYFGKWSKVVKKKVK